MNQPPKPLFRPDILQITEDDSLPIEIPENKSDGLDYEEIIKKLKEENEELKRKVNQYLNEKYEAISKYHKYKYAFEALVEAIKK